MKQEDPATVRADRAGGSVHDPAEVLVMTESQHVT